MGDAHKRRRVAERSSSTHDAPAAGGASGASGAGGEGEEDDEFDTLLEDLVISLAHELRSEDNDQVDVDLSVGGRGSLLALSLEESGKLPHPEPGKLPIDYDNLTSLLAVFGFSLHTRKRSDGFRLYYHSELNALPTLPRWADAMERLARERRAKRRGARGVGGQPRAARSALPAGAYREGGMPTPPASPAHKSAMVAMGLATARETAAPAAAAKTAKGKRKSRAAAPPPVDDDEMEESASSDVIYCGTEW